MNRRSFIAGLLASSAAVPIASSFAADMGLEVIPYLPPDPQLSSMFDTIALFRQEIVAAFQVRQVLQLAAVPDLDRWVMYDEAANFTEAQWDYLRLYGGAAGGAMDASVNLEANHDDTDHRAGGRNPDAAGDREP